MRYEIAARSVIGGRSYQEDSWRVRNYHGLDLANEVGHPEGAVVPGAALVLVADGMGGHGGGAAASQVVADSFTAAYFKSSPDLKITERLEQALDAANRALAEAKRSGSAEINDRSGTTLIAGALIRKFLVFLSVGDSSIWRFRDNEVHRVNAAHERAADIDVRAAELGTEEAWGYALGDENRFAITSAVMGDKVREKQVEVRRIEDGDVLIFSSDGIETLSLEHLRRAVPAFLKQGGVSAVADGLIDLIQRTGGATQDNTTLIVVHALQDSAKRDVEELDQDFTATARTAPIGPPPAASAPAGPAVPSPPGPRGADAGPPGGAAPAGSRRSSPWLAGVALALAIGAALLWWQPWAGWNQPPVAASRPLPGEQAATGPAGGPAAPPLRGGDAPGGEADQGGKAQRGR